MRWTPLLLIAVPLVAACRGPQLMPTPNLYLDDRPAPFDAVPEARRSSEIDILYATDRAPDSEEGEPLSYGTDRSLSLAVGHVSVRIGNELAWDDLVRASRTDARDVALPIHVDDPTELARYPQTPYAITSSGDDSVTVEASVAAARDGAARQLQDEVRRRLAESQSKDAWVYVHGFNNSFSDAVSVLSQIWHFMGRPGIAIAYSWPASASYATDRESGEFSVFHLKEFVRNLAASPELNRIHFLAHSRGTDVLTDALRELIIESRGAGAELRNRYKIGRVVLAAPDLDGEVFAQRIAAENLQDDMESFTIYGSDEDTAIALSGWLWGSHRRLARVHPEDLPESARAYVGAIENAAFVDADISGGFTGHSYFYESPAVSSDLILVWRDGLRRQPVSHIEGQDGQALQGVDDRADVGGLRAAHPREQLVDG